MKSSTTGLNFVGSIFQNFSSTFLLCLPAFLQLFIFRSDKGLKVISFNCLVFNMLFLGAAQVFTRAWISSIKFNSEWDWGWGQAWGFYILVAETVLFLFLNPFLDLAFPSAAYWCFQFISLVKMILCIINNSYTFCWKTWKNGFLPPVLEMCTIHFFVVIFTVSKTNKTLPATLSALHPCKF